MRDKYDKKVSDAETPPEMPQRKVKQSKRKVKDKVIKLHYADLVSLSEIEYEKLVNEHGHDFTMRCITTLDNYKGSSGKKYASDYRTILNWVVDRVREDEKKLTVINGRNYGKTSSFDRLQQLAREEQEREASGHY